MSSSPRVLARETISPDGRDDAAPADEVRPLLLSGLRDADHPGAVHVGAGLHDQMVVEVREVVVDRLPGDVRRRVVAEEHELGPLKPEHPIGLRPAPIVADAHPDDAVERPPRRKAEVADLEIALLQMLKGKLRPVVGMTRQVHLAVLPDLPPLPVDQNRRVVAAGPALLLRKLAVAEVEADSEPGGLVEQGPGLGSRHLALEETVDLGLILHPPAGKEARERDLGEDHELAARCARLAKQLDHAFDDVRTALVTAGRPELGPAHGHDTGHAGVLLSSRASRRMHSVFSTSIPSSGVRTTP